MMKRYIKLIEKKIKEYNNGIYTKNLDKKLGETINETPVCNTLSDNTNSDKFEKELFDCTNNINDFINIDKIDNNCNVPKRDNSYTPMDDNSLNPFNDVSPNMYYFPSVLWAVNHTPQITNGTSATAFSPEATCTRGQVVTFLWRAHEKPAAGKNNPFKDVAAGQYYTDAVLWAVSKNITNGIDATHFGPDNPCTRGQIVTFLYRDLKK